MAGVSLGVLAFTMVSPYEIAPFPHVCPEKALNRGVDPVELWGGLQVAQP